MIVTGPQCGPTETTTPIDVSTADKVDVRAFDKIVAAAKPAAEFQATRRHDSKAMSGDVFDKGDPKKLFKLLNKLATGSYGTVFKARSRPATLIYHCIGSK